MILDVGCGFQPRGDVNCDLYVKDSLNHRNQGEGSTIQVHRVPNFVVCDAQFLPFQDRVFETVFCGQVIEHLENPLRLLKELSRVSAWKVQVETVHRFGENLTWRPKERVWFRIHHVSKFNRKWFVRASRYAGLRFVRMYVLSWRNIPTDFFILLRFPFEIGVIYEKWD